MIRLFIITLLIVGIGAMASDFIKGYELQQLNQIEVSRCSIDMASNPDLICDYLKKIYLSYFI